jgi:hypothetical protein
MGFAETFTQLADRGNAHRFQGTVEEHIAVKAGGVVADFGDDVFVAQHHQGGDGIGDAGKSAGVPGSFAGCHLQGQIPQRIRRQQGLVNGCRVTGGGDCRLPIGNGGFLAVGIKVGQSLTKIGGYLRKMPEYWEVCLQPSCFRDLN